MTEQLIQGVVMVYQTFNATTGTLMNQDALEQMVMKPKATAKLDTLLILSTDAPGKTKEIIIKHNNMTLSWIDLDEGDKSLKEVKCICEEYGITKAYIYSTSKSMKLIDGIQYRHRWRVLIPLSQSLPCEHWLTLQKALASIFGGGLEACRLQQGFFAPTISDGGYYEYAII
jgi:hypothetical protein